MKLCKALGALGSCGVDSWLHFLYVSSVRTVLYVLLQFLYVRSFLPSNPPRIIQQICAEEPMEGQSCQKLEPFTNIPL